MDINAQKTELRQSILAKLKALTAEQRNSSSAVLRQKLSAVLNTERVLTVALYAPLPHEVDLMPLLKEYPQHRYAFPRCTTGRKLHFHHVRNPEFELIPGALNIPAPSAELPVIMPEEFDFIIVPGVAFTSEGKRLGYGGGYYDRYLPACSQAELISLAFPEQLLSNLPTDTHDLRIHQLITL